MQIGRDIWLWVCKHLDEIFVGLLVSAIFAAIGAVSKWIPSLWGRFGWKVKQPNLVAGKSPSKIFSVPLYLTSIVLLALAIACVAVWIRQQERNIRQLHTEMVRFVLPRTLSEEQKRDIGVFLKKTEPRQVIIQVASNDREAGSYASDIWNGLLRGGWAATFKDKADMPEGLTLSIEQPLLPQLTPLQEANAKPDSFTILKDAFKNAGIEVNGTGGGSGSQIKTTTITIFVGRRPRDSWAVTPKNFVSPALMGNQIRTDGDVY